MYTITIETDNLFGTNQIIDYPYDILAASCQMNMDNLVLFARNEILTIVPTPAACEMALKVKNYFLDKFNRMALSGQQLSSFRNRLYTFLAGRKELDSSDIGMICRTPYYYNEDLLFSKVMESMIFRQLPNDHICSDLHMKYLGAVVHRASGSMAGRNNRYCYSSEVGNIFIETKSPLEVSLMEVVGNKDLVFTGNLKSRRMLFDGETPIEYFVPSKINKLELV